MTQPRSRHHGAELATELPALADLIAERFAARQLELSRWVGADVVAVHLGVDVSFVYEHAVELGARRLGNSPKARLRFQLELVDAALLPTAASPDAQQTLTIEPRRRRTRSARSATSVPLLPIRGANRAT